MPLYAESVADLIGQTPVSVAWLVPAKIADAMYGHASTAEAIAMADRLAAEEGLLVGPSSGAAVHAAIELARMDDAAGKTIVVIQASSGIRYVTHPCVAITIAAKLSPCFIGIGCLSL